eukprot:scaffold3552_cov140-Skeletonema_marinoi.AAC.11
MDLMALHPLHYTSYIDKGEASIIANREGNGYKSDHFVRLSRTEAVMKREWELVDDSVNSRRQFIGHDCGVFVITNITLLAQKIPSTAQTYTEAIFLEQNTRERMHFSSGLPPVKKIVPPSPDYTTKTDEAGNCIRLNEGSKALLQHPPQQDLCPVHIIPLFSAVFVSSRYLKISILPCHQSLLCSPATSPLIPDIDLSTDVD